LVFERVALLLPSDDKTVPAFTFTCLQKVFGSRNYLIIFPPLSSTFQRTLCSGWRWSVSFGVTLRVPAPALPTARLSPVRSGLHFFGPPRCQFGRPSASSPLTFGPVFTRTYLPVGLPMACATFLPTHGSFRVASSVPACLESCFWNQVTRA
jgi:hypothetical protein